MTLGPEAALAFCAIGLYAFDAVVLLRVDAMVLVQDCNGAWWPRFGLQGWRLGGREPWLPNLFRPAQAMVRVQWDVEAPIPSRGLHAGQAALPQPRPWLGRACLTQWGLICVALPACLLIYPSHNTLAGIAVAIYATTLSTLAKLYRQRASIGLSDRSFAGLAFESLACPPFAINQGRKLGLLGPPRPLASVWSALAPAAQTAAAAGMRSRVMECMELEPEGTARMQRLRVALEVLNQVCLQALEPE